MSSSHEPIQRLRELVEQYQQTYQQLEEAEKREDAGTVARLITVLLQLNAERNLLLAKLVEQYKQTHQQLEEAKKREDAGTVARLTTVLLQLNTDRNWQVCEVVNQYKNVYRQRDEAIKRKDTATVEQWNVILQQLVEGLYVCLVDRLYGRVRHLLRGQKWEESDWYKDAATYNEFIDQGVHDFLLFVLAKLHTIKPLDPKRGPIAFLLRVAENEAKRKMLPPPPPKGPPISDPPGPQNPLGPKLVPLPDEEDISDPKSEKAWNDLDARLFNEDVKKGVIECSKSYSEENQILIYGRVIEKKTYEQIAQEIFERLGVIRSPGGLRQAFLKIKAPLLECLRDKGLLGGD